MERLQRQITQKSVIVPEEDVKTIFDLFVPASPVQMLEDIKAMAEKGIQNARYAKKDPQSEYGSPTQVIIDIEKHIAIMRIASRMQEALEEKEPEPGNDQ